MIKIPEQFKIKEQVIHNTYLINGEISTWDGDFVDVYSTLLTKNEDDSLFKLEKAAIKAKKATPAQVKKAEDIASQIKATTKDMGKAVSSVAYVDGHVDKVKELA